MKYFPKLCSEAREISKKNYNLSGESRYRDQFELSNGYVLKFCGKGIFPRGNSRSGKYFVRWSLDFFLIIFNFNMFRNNNWPSLNCFRLYFQRGINSGPLFGRFNYNRDPLNVSKFRPRLSRFPINHQSARVDRRVVRVPNEYRDNVSKLWILFKYKFVYQPHVTFTTHMHPIHIFFQPIYNSGTK